MIIKNPLKVFLHLLYKEKDALTPEARLDAIEVIWIITQVLLDNDEEKNIMTVIESFYKDYPSRSSCPCYPYTLTIDTLFHFIKVIKDNIEKERIGTPVYVDFDNFHPKSTYQWYGKKKLHYFPE